jgi:hypothetical protein
MKGTVVVVVVDAQALTQHELSRLGCSARNTQHCVWSSRCHSGLLHMVQIHCDAGAGDGHDVMRTHGLSLSTAAAGCLCGAHFRD